MADDAVRVSPAAGGRCEVSGRLTFASAARASALGIEAIDAGAPAAFDLQGVSRADSAGLAVLVEWARAARARGAEVRFENPPQQLRDLARAARLEHLLGA